MRWCAGEEHSDWFVWYVHENTPAPFILNQDTWLNQNQDSLTAWSRKKDWRGMDFVYSKHIVSGF